MGGSWSRAPPSWLCQLASAMAHVPSLAKLLAGCQGANPAWQQLSRQQILESMEQTAGKWQAQLGLLLLSGADGGGGEGASGAELWLRRAHEQGSFDAATALAGRYLRGGRVGELGGLVVGRLRRAGHVSSKWSWR